MRAKLGHEEEAEGSVCPPRKRHATARPQAAVFFEPKDVMASEGLRVLHELRDETRAVIKGLSGTLDENLDPAVFDPGGARFLGLDLHGVRSVSSFGVRAWIQYLSDVARELDALYLLRASPRINDQLNMVVGFDAGGLLLSFESFYICDACGSETPALFDVQLDRDAFDRLEAPPRQCQACGLPAKLDDDPSILFEYVRSAPFGAPPREILNLIRKPESWMQEVPGLRLTTRQQLHGVTTVVKLAGIIDNSLPVRRLASSGGETPVTLQLSNVTHVVPDAVDLWRDLLDALVQKGTTRLRGVPPVLLRRLLEEPSLFGAADVEDVLLPMKCPKCGASNWSLFRTREKGSWREKTPQCLACQTPMRFQSGAELVAQFEQALRERPRVDPRQRAGIHTQRRRNDAVAPRTLTQVRHNPAEEASFSDKYEVLCRIGRGGMADVYIARQHGAMGFKRLMVIKQVRQELLADDRMIRLFLDEARLAARIDHHNVVRVHDLGRNADGFYMVMDFVHGLSMDAVISRLEGVPRVPPRVAVSIAADLCAGLAHAHRPTGDGEILVHRDVTPNNVMLSFEGIVKLTDFGLAGYHRFKKDKMRAGALLGNVPYVPPEVLRGRKATAQSDLWSAGLVLYTMLAGVNFFRRDTIQETVRAIINDSVKRPRAAIPRKVFPIIRRALKKHPQKRYAAAAEMEQDLRAILPKLAGPTDIRQWMRELFSDQLNQEAELTRRFDAAALEDALLAASSQEVAEFFGAEPVNSGLRAQGS